LSLRVQLLSNSYKLLISIYQAISQIRDDHVPVILFHFGLNILLSTLYSEILNLCFSVNGMTLQNPVTKVQLCGMDGKTWSDEKE